MPPEQPLPQLEQPQPGSSQSSQTLGRCSSRKPLTMSPEKKKRQNHGWLRRHQCHRFILEKHPITSPRGRRASGTPAPGSPSRDSSGGCDNTGSCLPCAGRIALPRTEAGTGAGTGLGLGLGQGLRQGLGSAGPRALRHDSVRLSLSSPCAPNTKAPEITSKCSNN